MSEEIKQVIKDETLKKIFQEVFDEQTISVLHELAGKDYFDYVEFLISPGKEALVFRARDSAGNFKAVKVYKIKTSDFKNMNQYIEGDRRFEKVKKTKQAMVFAWARKEFKNLQLLYEAGIHVPIPLTFKGNVLVMEFIGEKNAAPILKEKPISDTAGLYEKIVEALALMIGKAKIVHADLSEYNILNYNEEPVIIDCGQAVLLSHPNAKEFFERDVKNMAKYFSKQGLKKSFEEMYAEVKQMIEEIKKRELNKK